MTNETEFQVGDIVEILNLSKHQIEDILSQTNATRTVENLKAAIIGARYKVEYIIRTDGFYKTNCVSIENWNQGGHSAHVFEFSQVRLYHRPKRNDQAVFNAK